MTGLFGWSRGDSAAFRLVMAATREPAPPQEVVTCERCGAEAHVDWVEVTTFANPAPVHAMGASWCPTPGCVNPAGSRAVHGTRPARRTHPRRPGLDRPSPAPRRRIRPRRPRTTRIRGQTMIVYISVGNSDDKLSQADWSSFVLDVDRAFDSAVRYEGARVHGRWYSLPHDPWQNACWCGEWHDDLAHVTAALKRKLATIARAYRQDSIAWAEVTTTEFITAPFAAGGVVAPGTVYRVDGHNDG